MNTRVKTPAHAPSAASGALRVLLVDDHAIVREGLRALLEEDARISIVAEASNGDEATEMAARLTPDLVLMDLKMPGLPAADAIRVIRARSPATHVLVLTSYVDDEQVQAVLSAGALGYVLKDVAKNELLRAMQMRRSHAITGTAWIVACCVFSSPALAQYEVEQDRRVWLRALLDVRLVRAGPATSWTDAGFGKMRYGGEATASGFERKTRLELAQLAIEIGAALPWNVRAQLQVNLEHDLADDYEPWLIEAILRKEWGDAKRGFGVQTGLMNTPFSLEHTGPAWLPEYTITASALNSWLWEDTSLAGVEGEWWHATRSGIRLGALAGVGFGPDQFGRLLALRGWAMGDGLSGLNSDLALPNRSDRTDVFDERDGRPAAYARLTLSDAQEIATLKLGYFDLDGPPNTTENGHAVTLAYQYQFGLRHRLAAEYIWMQSHRVASPVPNPTPDGWQVSYRYRY